MLINGCSALSTAQNQYGKGDFLSVIETVTRYLDSKGVADSDSITMITMIADITQQYENKIAQTSLNDYETRINNYIDLLYIRNHLDKKPYDQHISFFTHKYSVLQLKENVAKQYYDFADSVPITNDKHSYQLKAKLYGEGLTYFAYRDISQKHEKVDKKYRSLAAEEAYKMASIAVKEKDYSQAAKKYAKAYDIYQVYGNYKDSSTLHTRYDKLYRKEKSLRFYNDAKTLAKTAATKANYCEVAKLFKNAYTVYENYGSLNDAKTFYEKYYQQGIISVYLQADRNWYDIVAKRLSDENIALAANSTYATVVIYLDEDFRYDEDKNSEQMRPLTEKVFSHKERDTKPNGETYEKDVYKVYDYQKKSVTSSNKATIALSLNVSGARSYNNQYRISRTSARSKITYHGDYPKKLKTEYNGTLETKSQLYAAIAEEIMSDLEIDLGRIHNFLLQL